MAHIAVTPGSGAFVATYADANGDSNPGGVAAYLVGATATPVDATHQMPVLATQAGTWTVTGAGGTFPVTAAALPLPAGASTAARQPALGIAGTSATDVLTIQGIASMTPVQVSVRDGAGNALTSIAVGSQRAVTVAIVDASGNQVTAFGGAGGTASNYGSAFPATGTAIGAKDSTGTNLAPLNLDASGLLKVNAAAGAVTANAGTNLNTSALALESGGHLAAIDGKAPALGQALAAASVPVVLTAAQLTTLTPVSAVTANQGGTWSVSLAPATSGGLSTSSTISAATTNATNIKASAGQIFGYAIFNTTGSPLYVKLYDSATAPTAGSGTPVRRLMVPANGGLERTLPNGLQFASGIGFTATANPADNDTAAVTLNALLINIDYK